MSIKFPGLNQADSFKTSQSVTAGFVKNNAAGDLLYGEVGPPSDASQWQIIESKSFDGSEGDTVTFSGLDGDVDQIYKLTMFLIPRSRTTVGDFVVQPNGITTGFQTLTKEFRHVVLGGTLRNRNTTFVQGWAMGSQFSNYGTWSTNAERSDLYIYAKTGRPRLSTRHSTFVSGIPILSQTAEPGIIIDHATGVWTDTTTNITSLVIFNRFGSNTFIGEWSLYKANI